MFAILKFYCASSMAKAKEKKSLFYKVGQYPVLYNKILNACVAGNAVQHIS